MTGALGRVPPPIGRRGGDGPRFRSGRVLAFLGLAFGLTWGLEPLIGATGRRAAYLEAGLHPIGMFVPAFAALVLQAFVFRDSPLHVRTHRAATRWVVYGFFAVAILNAVVTALALATDLRGDVLRGVGGLIVTLWTLSLFPIYARAGADGFRRVGLQLGDTALGVRFVAGVALFLLAQAALNALFGLGAFPGVRSDVGGVPVPSGWYAPALLVFFAITVVGVPLSGLAALFGEEYGWRGFLQGELTKLGPRRGVFLVGLIWGVWHVPVFFGGAHTYPGTAAGVALGVTFFVLAGFVFGYAAIKTGSVWVVAFMHGVLNAVHAFVVTYLVRPHDGLWSFGLGVYGLASLALVVLWILRDPVWRGRRDRAGPAAMPPAAR